MIPGRTTNPSSIRSRVNRVIDGFAGEAQSQPNSSIQFRTLTMHHVRQECLPFVGSSREFIGSEQGDTGISVFLYHGQPGSGPGAHRHPYDEVEFVREGRGVWTVNGKIFEGGAGDI